MIRAGGIRAMQSTRRGRFTHQGTVYEGYVQWIEDNDSLMSHEKKHSGCVSLMLDTGQTLNDLPKTTAVESL